MTDGNIVNTNTDTPNTGANIRTFTHKNHQLHTLLDRNGDPWFLAKDVCDILELDNVTNALRNLDEDEKSNLTNCNVGGIATIPGLDTTNGGRAPLIVSEAGLYSLILRSRKPEAKQFKRWITHKVLPSIRKHGGYMTGQESMTPEQMLHASMKWLESRIAEQQKQLAQQAPKVKFADSVETAQSSILIGELARDLRQNGVNIGQNHLFAWLRDHKYLIARKGESWNEPTQRALDMDLFQVKTRVIDNPDGSKRITRTTKVTGKGRVYFTNLLLDRNA